MSTVYCFFDPTPKPNPRCLRFTASATPTPKPNPRCVRLNASSRLIHQYIELAKAAAYSKDDFAYKKCPLSRAKTEYKAHIINTWNSQWTNSNNGSITKDPFFPDVHSRLKCTQFLPDFITTQFTSGHGKFRSYFRRFHIKGENGFECTCGSEQTVERLLFDCPVFGNRRFRLEMHIYIYIYTCIWRNPLCVWRNSSVHNFDKAPLCGQRARRPLQLNFKRRFVAVIRQEKAPCCCIYSAQQSVQ
jgi:hypothetical protein